MIKWQGNKAGFVGGAKTAIKGAFQLVYSAFIAPIPPPVEGIDSTTCFPGTIDDKSFGGTITAFAFNGDIADSPVFSGSIADFSFSGSITELEFNGSIQTDC